MSINNFFFSPKNYQRNNILFQQYNPNFPKLEKEILKLINYLRTNPEKYLTEFSKFFRNDLIDKIIDELNKLETKLFPFNTKKEINQAGKDYLDFMIENDIDNSYFNNNDNDKNCFHLKARLSKYGNRNGKIFESVIINSSCAEEIVNKLIKDEKARNMILSPYMKYIGINCGFMPKWNRICTIIDIVQDFIAYKDINDYNNDNSIQIINTIENDDTENMSDKKKDHNKSQNINIINYSETFKNSKMVDNKENINNLVNKTNKEKFFSIMERKKNVNHALYKNRLNNNFNKIFEEKAKLISPLATYKSDAHLVFNQINSSIKRNPTSMNRINSYIINDINCETLAFKQFSMAGTKSQNLYDLPKKINININNENNDANIKNKTLIENNNSDNNHNNSLKNDKNSKYITERIKGREKNSIFHSLNELKNKLDKKKDEEKGKIGEKETETEGIYIEENNQIINNNPISKRNDDITHINKEETIKTELTQINKDVKNNDNNNHSISFDNKSYSFVNKDNQNQKENSLNNDNVLLTIEQINNNNNNVIEVINKQSSFFSYNNTDIKNILTNKNQIKNLKQLKVNTSNNIDKDNERNKCQIDYKDISFKIDKTIEENNNSTIKENKIKNKKDIDDKCDNNDNDDINDIDIEQYNYNSENIYLHKNKKEIKQLIRLYNKERIEQKNKNISNNLNSNNNNDCSTKKSTATFFYINNKKDNDSKNKDEKKIKVYKKQKINPSGSKNKIIQKKNTCYNNIHQKDKKSANLIPAVIKTKTKFQNANSRSSENLLLTENNIYDYNSRKRLYIYNRNHSKLYKNRSFEKNVERSNNNKLIKYLDKKNIDDVEDNVNKSQYFHFKRFSNCNDNLDTNVNSDNNNDVINDFFEENKKRKEYNSNMNTNNLFYSKNKLSISKNYIYKRKPENKNFFNFYCKDINKNLIKKDKNKFDTTNIDNISQTKDKRKYMSMQFDISYQK